MNIAHDKVADAVYIKVSSNTISNTMRVTDALLVDTDKNGSIVGFEILGASSQGALLKDLQKDVANGVPVAISEATPANV